MAADRCEKAGAARVDADDVAHPRGGNVPRGTEAVAQLHAEPGVVDGPGRTGVGRTSSCRPRRPPAVHALGHVGHHQMGMEMGIEGPAGPVHELAGHQPGVGRTGDPSGPGATDPEAARWR